MALVLADRVRETTVTTGTGTVTLAGAATGYQSFSVIGNGNTTYYCIASQTLTEWEVGIGTWATGGTLARTTVLSSSNAGSAVNFSAGTKDVFVTYPSTYTVNTQTGAPAVLNTSNNYQVNSIGVGAAASGTAGRINATTGVFTPGTSGVSTGLTCVNGDITAYRTGGTTGVIYLSSSGSNYLYWDGTNYNLNSGNLICTGNITAYSDETLKTNWRELPEDFLQCLSQLKHGIYDRVDSGDTQAGISAQRLKEFLPQVVQTDENGKLSVAYGNAAMVSAVQLAQRVVEQDKRIAALEELVAKLVQGDSK